jgi:hypothetical protein
MFSTMEVDPFKPMDKKTKIDPDEDDPDPHTPKPGWQLLIWDNKQSRRTVPEDYTLAVTAWQYSKTDGGECAPVEIVEDRHLERPFKGTLFDKIIFDDPGFEYLPFTRRLRAVAEPRASRVITLRFLPNYELSSWKQMGIITRHPLLAQCVSCRSKIIKFSPMAYDLSAGVGCPG